MNTNRTKTFAVFLVGLSMGVGLSHFSVATAAVDGSAVATDLTKKRFHVFVDEVKTNLVFGDEFTGRYSKTFTLSDGSHRTVELTPMVHNGMQVVELKDTGGLSYMSLSGTTTNGQLMVQVRDETETHRLLKEQGWKLP
jgi:hypothetical protein